jgi:hypothetical protein
MGSEIKDYQELLAQADDLDAVKAALVRESVIRETMAESQESREVVELMVDSFDSMNQESVLELTDGQPTTLRAALSKYIDDLEQDIEAGDALGPVSIAGDLHAILQYPYSRDEEILELHAGNHLLELEIEDHPDYGRDQVVKIGGHVVARLDWERAGSGGVAMGEEIARAVHAAVRARIVPDRDHYVGLSSSDRRSLLSWLENPHGTWTPDSPSRFSISEFQKTGLIVRTWPYAWARKADV